jgi:hypothetical protein
MNCKVAMTLILSAATLAGCGQHGNSASSASSVARTDVSPNDAIRTAIQAHLSHNGNLNLKSFDTEVKQVTIDRDRAEAQVEFHVKNGTGMMQRTYALAKRDGAWSVVESLSVDSNFSHPTPGQAQAPAAGGAMGGESSVFRALDNFHGRAAVTPPQNLPPGHPPVVASPNGVGRQTP